jgi:DNA-binding PadR family transcriptional regulator
MKPVERLKRKVLTENLWIFILKSLKRRELYGFEIRNMVKKEFGFLIGSVTAYKVLYLLEKDNYISSFRKGNVKYYKITQKGVDELQEAKRFLRSLA